MLYFYNSFYQKFGIRIAGQLVSPPLPKLELLDLPKQSILHYITTSPVENGPASDDYIFRNITRPIMVGHIVENGDVKGNPRHLALAPDTLIRTYHIKHRKFRLMRNVEAAARDSSTLIVYNYGLIPKLYRYLRSFYTMYYKWWNLQAAVWKNISTLAQTIDRNQFIICNLPIILPSVSDLRIGSRGVNQKVVRLFNSSESLMILELWKWFGEERKDSVLANVSDKDLNKVNLIFQESGKWFVMNLGRMNKWRIATKEELESNPEANVKGLAPKQLQLRYLRLMMALFQTRTVAINDESKPELSEKELNKDLQPVVVKKDIDIPELDKDTGVITTKTKIEEVPLEAEHDEETAVIEDETIHHDEELHKQIENDLAELDNISKIHYGEIDDEGITVKTEPKIQEASTLEGGVMRVCDRLADIGLLSAKEYKRFDELSKSYRNIVSPNGKDTLDKFITIEPKSLVLESSHEYKDIPTVPDKTMLKSSLHDFDKRYIKDVLQKDVAGMVMNLQNAGIAVTGYNVEHIDDVMGDYDYYTVKINPVEGAPSVLRYKLPTVSEDGTYVSNGTKYRMRKQRGDYKPIY